ncbi:MAG: DUF5330 domain-containing protein [Hyphomicrobium sp.]
MGLFKLAAVVAVGVSLLPAEREKQEQLYLRAASAATWTMTFCDRNAETCTKATNFWGEFSKKAEFGAKLAYDVLRDQDATRSGGDVAPATASFETAPATRGSTLTPHDLRPAWRGKTANKAGI